MILWLRQLIEYLNGVQDEPPTGFLLTLSSPMWALWWMVLVIVILFFCGQSSKFIYIDF